MSIEPTISLRSLPRGYSHVPKGNVYITGNCRKSTQATGQTVYIVINKQKKQIGIAVPADIHNDVRAKEAETRSQRVANVEKRDAGIETEFDKVIREEYPQIPAEDLSNVLKKALEKRKGKVGRTGRLEMAEKARLAVRAHIRHCHTPYDQYLREKSKPKPEARELVKDQVNTIARSWGETSRSSKASGLVRAKPAKPAKPVIAKLRATVKTKATVGQQSSHLPVHHTKKSTHELPLRQPRHKEHPLQPPNEIIDLTKDESPEPVLLPEHNSPSQTPRRITRSMNQIKLPIQVLAQRLPDSPEPEPFGRSTNPVVQLRKEVQQKIQPLGESYRQYILHSIPTLHMMQNHARNLSKNADNLCQKPSSGVADSSSLHHAIAKANRAWKEIRCKIEQLNQRLGEAGLQPLKSVEDTDTFRDELKSLKKAFQKAL